MTARCALYIGYFSLILFTPTSTTLRGFDSERPYIKLLLNAGSRIDAASQTNAAILKQRLSTKLRHRNRKLSGDTDNSLFF